jgi:FtsP/CotA-like multicopper oxidase with cupredoxin domain
VTGSPSGYARRIYAINRQFPGPLIEANEGDTIVVHVQDNLDIGQTIRECIMLPLDAA